MARKPFFLLYLLCLVAIDRAGAQAAVLQGPAGAAQGSKPNVWRATSTRGLTLIGTWTAVPANQTVIGTWTLVDAEGTILSGGGWSASKAPTRWSGLWRANISGSEAEYSGSWGAPDVGLRPGAAFKQLFAEAVRAAVEGVWRGGGHSGAWTIWAFK